MAAAVNIVLLAFGLLVACLVGAGLAVALYVLLGEEW